MHTLLTEIDEFLKEQEFYHSENKNYCKEVNALRTKIAEAMKGKPKPDKNIIWELATKKAMIENPMGDNFQRIWIAMDLYHEAMEAYAIQEHGTQFKSEKDFWFEKFNSIFPDTVEGILKSDSYKKHLNSIK